MEKLIANEAAARIGLEKASAAYIAAWMAANYSDPTGPIRDELVAAREAHDEAYVALHVVI